MSFSLYSGVPRNHKHCNILTKLLDAGFHKRAAGNSRAVWLGDAIKRPQKVLRLLALYQCRARQPKSGSLTSHGCRDNSEGLLGDELSVRGSIARPLAAPFAAARPDPYRSIELSHYQGVAWKKKLEIGKSKLASRWRIALFDFPISNLMACSLQPVTCNL